MTTPRPAPVQKVMLLNPPGSEIYLRDYYCSHISKASYIYCPYDLFAESGWLSTKFDVDAIDAIADGLSAADLRLEAGLEAHGPGDRSEDLAMKDVLPGLEHHRRTHRGLALGDVDRLAIHRQVHHAARLLGRGQRHLDVDDLALPCRRRHHHSVELDLFLVVVLQGKHVDRNLRGLGGGARLQETACGLVAV